MEPSSWPLGACLSTRGRVLLGTDGDVAASYALNIKDHCSNIYRQTMGRLSCFYHFGIVVRLQVELNCTKSVLKTSI